MEESQKLILRLVNGVEVGLLATEISPNHRGNRSLRKTTLPPQRTFQTKGKPTKMDDRQRKSLTKCSHNSPSRGDSNSELNLLLVPQVRDSIIESDN